MIELFAQIGLLTDTRERNDIIDFWLDATERKLESEAPLRRVVLQILCPSMPWQETEGNKE